MQNYNLPAVAYGNTFNGVKFTLPTADSFNLTDAKITMQVRVQPNWAVVDTMTLENGKITLETNYKFVIAPFVVVLPPATYQYDILIDFSDGRKKTYIGGQWVITPVITK